MSFLLSLVWPAAARVWTTFAADWMYLAGGALVSVLIRLYVDQKKVAGFLNRNQARGVLAATLVAVTTPLCSCGTTAVILGMMANSMPWAPIVAFMVASPLTSPSQLFYSAGLFGWPFALTFFVASVVLGLAGGLAAYALERAGWLKGQVRAKAFDESAAAADGGAETCACGCAASRHLPGLREVAIELLRVLRRLIPLFALYAFIGYFLNGLIPATLVSRIFGGGRALGVPVAATLGLPLYINTEASLPLLKGLMAGGMSPGSGLAFLITGAGTSMGAMAGALTIARWRVIAVVVATLWIGAILFGWGFNAAAAIGLL
jgi:uncharacterized membrane protein YraQ (UPF0718 family)